MYPQKSVYTLLATPLHCDPTTIPQSSVGHRENQVLEPRSDDRGGWEPKDLLPHIPQCVQTGQSTRRLSRVLMVLKVRGQLR